MATIPLLGSSQAVQNTALALGLRTLPPHIDSILLSTASFTLLYTVLAEPLSRFLIPKQWASFNEKEKADWKLRVVSFAQSIILGPASVYVLAGQYFWWEPRGLVDRVYGYYEVETQITNVAFGYFLWHMVMMVIEYKKHGIQMILHALIGVGCLGGVYVPFTPTMTAWFLVYEVTNIPHNIYRFLFRLGQGNSRASVVNAIIWIASFFVFRILWGTYATFVYLTSTFAVWKTSLTREGLGETEYAAVKRLEAEGLRPQNIGAPVMVLTMLAGFTLASLNYVWFYLIVKTTARRISKMKGRKETKSE